MHLLLLEHHTFSRKAAVHLCIHGLSKHQQLNTSCHLGAAACGRKISPRQDNKRIPDRGNKAALGSTYKQIQCIQNTRSWLLGGIHIHELYQQATGGDVVMSTPPCRGHARHELPCQCLHTYRISIAYSIRMFMHIEYTHTHTHTRYSCLHMQRSWWVDNPVEPPAPSLRVVLQVATLDR